MKLVVASITLSSLCIRRSVLQYELVGLGIVTQPYFINAVCIYLSCILICKLVLMSCMCYGWDVHKGIGLCISYHCFYTTGINRR